MIVPTLAFVSAQTFTSGHPAANATNNISHLMRWAARLREPIREWALRRRAPARDGAGRRRCHGKTQLLASADPASDDRMPGWAIEEYTGCGNESSRLDGRNPRPLIGAGVGCSRSWRPPASVSFVTPRHYPDPHRGGSGNSQEAESLCPLETVRESQFRTNKVSLLPACGWQGTYGVALLIL